MKYSAHIYAEALAEAIGEEKGADTLVKNFLALVQKNGDAGQLRKIVEEAAQRVRHAEGKRKVAIESARKLTPAQRKSVEQFLKSGDIIEERIDPDLVAGLRIIINDEMQFDGSLRKKLNTLFKDTN